MAFQKSRHHGMMDLDDACLMRIFRHLTPLPDLFQVAQTCWRFHRLASDKRMWLVVAPTSISPEATPSGRAGPVYTTLKAAVAASKPGDTIWLAPGMLHDATEVTIPWPLHILGGGLQPEDTQLFAAQSADFALSFSASAKLAMLAVATTLCPCLVHRKGLLTVERCRLSADAKGLQHLVSPVVTLAASSVGAAAALPAGSRLSIQAVYGSSSTSISGRMKASVGTGRLVIVECKLEGGSTAIQCNGTGRLRDVRVIYESRAAFFWLEVDSADPGVGAAPALAATPVIAAVDARLALTGQQQQQQQQEAQEDFMVAGTAAEEVGQEVELLAQISKVCEWQKQRRVVTSGQQHEQSLLQLQQQQWHSGRIPAVQGASGVNSSAACPMQGLARIQHVLGKHVNPATLAAHLGARGQQASRTGLQQQ